MEPKTAANLCLSAAKVKEVTHTHILLHGGRLGSLHLWSKRQAASLRRLLRSGRVRLSPVPHAASSPPELLLTVRNELPATAPPTHECIVIPTDDKDRIRDVVLALWQDPAAGGFRGARTIHAQLAQRYVGISERAVSAVLKQEPSWQVTVPVAAKVVRPLRPTRPEHVAADLFFVSRQPGSRRDPVLPGAGPTIPILIAVDAFSKYLWGAVLPCKSAASGAGGLLSFWLVDGAPSALQTDAGCGFKNVTARRLCQRFGVDYRVCRPFHSRCNGVIER